MITLPSGDIARPNGSGAGKQKLYGAGNNLEIDFARSSSAQNTAETNAGLQSFPFALDQLQMVVSNTVAVQCTGVADHRADRVHLQGRHH